MKGQTITKVTLRREDLRYPLPVSLKERLEGRRILELKRRAKYLLIVLDSQEVLMIHLGMSGRIKVLKTEEPLDKHDHVIFNLANSIEIRYHDPRRFGAIDLISQENIENHAALKKLGPEPFSNSYNAQFLLNRAACKTVPIKSFLLNQSVVAGLGNIYVCEILFACRIDPTSPAEALIVKQWEEIVVSTRDVLSRAIQAGGSTLKDHHQPNGEIGYFQHAFKVYGRLNKPCVVCGTLIQRLTQAGRATFYCPYCQDHVR